MTEKEFLEKHSEGWTWDAIEPVQRTFEPPNSLEIYRQVLGPGAVFLSCSVIIRGDDAYQIEIGSWPTRRYENDDDIVDPTDLLDDEPRWVNTDIVVSIAGMTTALQERCLKRAYTGAALMTPVWAYQTHFGNAPALRDATMRELPRELDRVLDLVAVRVLANLQRESRIAKQAKLIAEAAKDVKFVSWKALPR